MIRLTELLKENVTEAEIIAAIKLIDPAAKASGFRLHGKPNTKPAKRITTHAIWIIAGESYSHRISSRAVYLQWSKSTGLYVTGSKGGAVPEQNRYVRGTPKEWSVKQKWTEVFGKINESIERTVPDLSSPMAKKLGLKEKNFQPYVFSKGFPSDKRFALILIKTDGKVDVFSANNNMATTQTNLQKWSKDYAYKSEVKSWEIIPMKILTKK